MSRLLKSFATLLAALAVVALAFASGASRAQSGDVPPPFSQQVLDELLAPIALYPDALLTQVLIASTYPLEVVQAARLVNGSRDLAPDALVSVAESQPWDPSVIALVRFPSVLAMMDEKLDWTQKLGDAFLAQQSDVMDTVQSLRARAQAAGNLGSNAQQTVVVQERFIMIESAQPQFVYVPFFDPMFIYGNWWWGTPPRWVWAPPPRYWPPGWRPGWGPGVGWGRPIGAPPGIWHGRGPNWQNRNIVVNNTTVINNNTVINNGGRGSPVWTHNPGPRRGVSDPGWRGGTPPGATRPGGPDRTRPGSPQTPPAARPAPTRPGVGGNAPPQTNLPSTPGDSGARPGSRPRPGEATPPPATRPPRTGGPAGNPEEGRPARPAPRPAPQTPAVAPPGEPNARPTPPAPRPAPQAPAAVTPSEPGARPAPAERNRGGGGERESGSGRPGGQSPARATP